MRDLDCSASPPYGAYGNICLQCISSASLAIDQLKKKKCVINCRQALEVKIAAHLLLYCCTFVSAIFSCQRQASAAFQRPLLYQTFSCDLFNFFNNYYFSGNLFTPFCFDFVPFTVGTFWQVTHHATSALLHKFAMTAERITSVTSLSV